MKNITVFASGTEDDSSGRGFEGLVLASRDKVLHANIAVVISNHLNGGVRRKARRLGIPFRCFPGPYTAEGYQKILMPWQPDFIVLSGWLKKTTGLDPARTINIHPGPLPKSRGLYGPRLYNEVMAMFWRGEISCTEICMHFVTEEIDGGPVFFRTPIAIVGDNAETLERRVHNAELFWQPRITNWVVQGDISWDGTDPSSLRLPKGCDLARPQ